MKKRLRVCHFPQIPCKAFIVEVEDLNQAKLIFDTLASYDDFQYKNNIKPDYCNATCLEEWSEEDNDWINWYDEETGLDDLDEYFDCVLR